jgi:hypothetical protein
MKNAPWDSDDAERKKMCITICAQTSRWPRALPLQLRTFVAVPERLNATGEGR